MSVGIKNEFYYAHNKYYYIFCRRTRFLITLIKMFHVSALTTDHYQAQNSYLCFK